MLWIGIAGLIAAVMTSFAVRSITLDERGTVGHGTVIKVLRNHMNVVINNVYIRRRVLLEIPGPDGSTYQAVLPMLCEIGTGPTRATCSSSGSTRRTPSTSRSTRATSDDDD